MASLVFLNITNGAGLTPDAVKRMRGHITKANFAKRRQRITGENPQEIKKKKARKTGSNEKKDTDLSFLSPSGPFHTTTNQEELQLLIDLTCLNPPTTNSSEAAWVDLFASEPVLIETTMAVGMRHWSPQPTWQLQADLLASKALQSIIKRISWRQTYSDGFLAAILTMALGARLAQTDEVWAMHVDGLVQIINDRRGRGIKEPEWFLDILILDAVNYVFNYPRFYHKRVIDAISDSGDSRLDQVAEICEGMISLQQSIHSYNTGSNLNGISVAEDDITEQCVHLREKTWQLRQSKKNQYVHSTALSLEIILFLLWPFESHLQSVHNLASELQKTICQFPKSPCPYMDLTSCQYIVGAVGAASGSATRTWFVEKVTGVARTMQERGWSDEPSRILERLLGAAGLSLSLGIPAERSLDISLQVSDDDRCFHSVLGM